MPCGDKKITFFSQVDGPNVPEKDSWANLDF